jgi:hypothetical protein
VALHRAQQREMRGGLWPEEAWRGEIGGQGEEEASYWAPEHVRGVYIKISFWGEDTSSGKQFFCKFNRIVYASPPYDGSGYGFARSFRYAPFPRKTSATFCPPCKCYAFAYSGGQNVVNNQNVMRNFECPKFSEKGI